MDPKTIESLCIEAYLSSLNDKERKAMEIARSHLKTSFNIVRSNGFVKFKEKWKPPETAQTEIKKEEAVIEEKEEAVRTELKKEEAVRTELKKEEAVIEEKEEAVRTESTIVKKIIRIKKKKVETH